MALDHLRGEVFQAESCLQCCSYCIQVWTQSRRLQWNTQTWHKGGVSQLLQKCSPILHIQLTYSEPTKYTPKVCLLTLTHPHRPVPVQIPEILYSSTTHFTTSGPRCVYFIMYMEMVTKYQSKTLFVYNKLKVFDLQLDISCLLGSVSQHFEPKHILYIWAIPYYIYIMYSLATLHR